MMKSHIKGFSIFLLTNLFVFFIHYILKSNPENIVSIPLSYVVNASASLLLCICMYFLNETYKSQIGFIFLGLSFFKMIAIYFIVSPSNSDGLAVEEALTIFIPFFINLILEQLFMSKILNLGEILSPLKKD